MQNAKPVEINANMFEEYCCIICQLQAYEPVICSSCEMAVMCNSCKGNWQKSKGGNFECPSCKS